MRQVDFNEEFRQRTKMLSLAVIEKVSDLKYSDALGVIRKQLIRSVTSVAANYRAVCRARSDRELFAKLCIVVEEADETVFWLELLVDGKFIEINDIQEIQKEALEILKVMSAFRKSVSQRLRN